MSLSHATGNHWGKAPFAYLNFACNKEDVVDADWRNANAIWIFGRGTINPCGDYCDVTADGGILYIEPSAYRPSDLRAEHPRIHMDDFVAIGL